MEANHKDLFGIRIVSRLMILFASLVAFSAVAEAKGNMSPILPLQYSSRNLPLVDEALRDPELARKAPSDDLYAEQGMREIQEWQVELKTAKAIRREEVLTSLYMAHVMMSYYYADVVSGKITATGDRGQAASSLAAMRSGAVSYGTQLARLTKDKREKAKALYHVLMAQFAAGQNRAGAVRNLQQISSLLPATLKRRVAFASALVTMDRGQLSKGASEMKAAVGGLSKEGGIAGRLAIARSLAGLGGNGQRIARPIAGYRSYLSQATRSAANLPSNQKSAVLGFALAVWRGAEGASGSWDKSPINTAAFADLPEAKALVERSALADVSRGQNKRAIQKYRSLSAAYQGNPLMADLDRRLLDLHTREFARTKNVAAYEAALIETEAKYRDAGVFGQGGESRAQAVQQEFFKRYQALVYTMLQTAARPGANHGLRGQAIHLGETYLGRIQEPTEKVRVNTLMAQTYALDNQHAAAVAIYMDLALNAKGADSLKFLKAAIASQSVLAAWPGKAPWTKIPAGDPAARQALADMFQRVGKARPGDWSVMAHLGLLQISIGQSPAAFELWTKGLARSTESPHAAQAAGLMLTSYAEASNWQAIEDLAKLCLEKKLRPMVGNRPVDVRALLGDALYNGGKNAFAAGQYANAVKKLEEFTRVYRKDERRDDAMFVLASSYRGNGQHPESIKTLTALVEEYPNSKHHREALLNGGEWSMPMAYEEQTIFFYQRFLTRFASDNEAPRIRKVLVDLYLGRGLYGNASRLYKEQSLSPDVTDETRLIAAVNYMQIEERYGDKDRAQWGADRVLKLAGSNDGARALALGFQARAAQARNDIKTVAAIEGRLAGLDQSKQDVMEALGEARFMLAESKASITKAEIFNLGLKDPMATLNLHYSYFQKSKAAYEKVCDAVPNSYCAPAMMRLAAMTTNTIKTIEDLSVPDTLAESIERKFLARKESIIGTLAQIAEKSDNRSVDLIKDGNTTPTWTEQIIWTNSNDWNFDRVSGEAGNGYIQWAPVAPTGN